jgi:hypothetical protein
MADRTLLSSITRGFQVIAGCLGACPQTRMCEGHQEWLPQSILQMRRDSICH